jgi:hypothetical protein
MGEVVRSRWGGTITFMLQDALVYLLLGNEQLMTAV